MCYRLFLPPGMPGHCGGWQDVKQQETNKHTFPDTTCDKSGSALPEKKYDLCLLASKEFRGGIWSLINSGCLHKENMSPALCYHLGSLSASLFNKIKKRLKNVLIPLPSSTQTCDCKHMHWVNLCSKMTIVPNILGMVHHLLLSLKC